MKNLLCIAVVAAILITAGCVSVDRGKIRECGKVPYDLDNQFCCGNTLYTLQEKDEQHIGCCDGTVYDYNNYSCCYLPSGGFIYNPNIQGCCYEGGMYDRDTQDCCYRTVYNRTTQGCCRFAVYDLATQGCCAENDYKKVVFSTDSQHCCNRTVEPGGGKWDTCGSQCYNLDTQSCCYDGDTPTIHAGALSCCSGRPGSINGTKCDPATGLYPYRGPGYHYIPMGGNIWIVDYF